MPEATTITIADAVVARLNDPDAFGGAFRAERVYDVEFALEELQLDDAPKVAVAPRSVAGVPLARAQDSYAHEIDICVMKKVPDSSCGSCDPYALLVQQIQDDFLSAPEFDGQAFRVVSATIDPLYVPDFIRNMKVFFSIITLGVSEWRDE